MKKITIFASGIAKGSPGPAAVGVVVTDARGAVVREMSETIGNATGSFAQYYAVFRGLEVARDVFGKSTRQLLVEIKLDNEHVKKQLNAELQIKEPAFVPYFIEIHNLRVAHFPRCIVTFIRPEHNKSARQHAENELESKAVT